MPHLRIVNWNIENLSNNKVVIGNMAQNIGKVIASAHNPGGGLGAIQRADVVVITELQANYANAIVAMTAVANAANQASQDLAVAVSGFAPGTPGAIAAAAPHANDYLGWFVSYQSNTERYGLLIRDMNTVRPIIAPQPPPPPIPPGTPPPIGTETRPLVNYDVVRFTTWPGTFAAVANAYPLAANRPYLPLTDIFAGLPPRGRKRARFSGRRYDCGGYALGRGFRLPCLAMLDVQFGPNNYLIPIVSCHFGSSLNPNNPLARGQICQFKDIHISQKFMTPHMQDRVK